jgi:flavodoxin
MKRIIYYFSGTGNSMRAAYRIAEALTDTEIISMRCNPSEVPATDADVIGFVFPVFY